MAEVKAFRKIRGRRDLATNKVASASNFPRRWAPARSSWEPSVVHDRRNFERQLRSWSHFLPRDKKEKRCTS